MERKSNKSKDVLEITHLEQNEKPATVIIRHYNDSIVQVREDIVKNFKKALPFEIGQFRLKYKEEVPKEYKKDHCNLFVEKSII